MEPVLRGKISSWPVFVSWREQGWNPGIQLTGPGHEFGLRVNLLYIGEKDFGFGKEYIQMFFSRLYLDFNV